jgi:hypothetical protein
LSVTLVCQIALSWLSPARFRGLMIPGIVEKPAARAAGCAARTRGFGGFVPFVLTAALAAHASAAPEASTTSTPIGSAPATTRDLHVHLINEAGANPRTLHAAEAEASRIWASAGLRLTWTFPPVPFDVTDGRTVMVIVRRALSRPPTLDATDSHPCSHPPVGWLLFDEDGRPGNLIEVSFEKLTSLVMLGSHLDRPILALPGLARMSLLGRGLGRIVAHEIGHWLMGRGHTQQGLMRASLGVRDLLQSDAPRLPRAWTAAGSELRLPQSSRCELDALHFGTREAAPRRARPRKRDGSVPTIVPVASRNSVAKGNASQLARSVKSRKE